MSDRVVVLYSIPGCSQCEAARTFLRDAGFEFRDVDVMQDGDALRELATIAGQVVVPTIVFGGDVQVGWDAARVAEMLASPLPPEEEDFVLVLDEEDETSPVPDAIGAEEVGETEEEE